jgi:hypothetical protein
MQGASERSVFEASAQVHPSGTFFKDNAAAWSCVF